MIRTKLIIPMYWKAEFKIKNTEHGNLSDFKNFDFDKMKSNNYPQRIIKKFEEKQKENPDNLVGFSVRDSLDQTINDFLDVIDRPRMFKLIDIKFAVTSSEGYESTYALIIWNDGVDD